MDYRSTGVSLGFGYGSVTLLIGVDIIILKTEVYLMVNWMQAHPLFEQFIRLITGFAALLQGSVVAPYYRLRRRSRSR